MIQFTCPTCQAALTHPTAGEKVQCPKCGQRIRVPGPTPTNKTVLGGPPITTTPPTPPPLPPPEVVRYSHQSRQPEPDIRRTAPDNPPPEADRPSRRRPRDDYDDYDDRPRRRRRGPAEFRCPYCGTDTPLAVRSKISTAGWVVFVVLLLVCFPLCVLALLITEEYRVCRDCGIRLD